MPPVPPPSETGLVQRIRHYFGNPHSATPGNIMSYDRGQVPPFFDDAQSRRIARSAQRFARAGAPARVEREASAALPEQPN